MKTLAEYIWIDGAWPTAKLRSKTKVLGREIKSLADLPLWSFDGSSTGQATGHFSDCLLKPVCSIPDPIRGTPHLLIMCEVLNSDETPHRTNTRAHLAKFYETIAWVEALFGIEQEYTLYQKGHPFGWPPGGFLPPQGKYYCGVGVDEVFGRPLIEKHLFACLKSGLEISGVNAEVMPAQWEFQIGPLGPLETADQLWLARWLLYRLGEDYGIYAKLDPKPMEGDWNGAGGHTNFSIQTMRDYGGIEIINQACLKLETFHEEHMKVYGADNDKRLTGKHETCSIHEFRFGVSDRGASIRIPLQVSKDGCGYLEDRRPAANLDPYQVITAILETVCGSGFNAKSHGWPLPENY